MPSATKPMTYAAVAAARPLSSISPPAQTGRCRATRPLQTPKPKSVADVATIDSGKTRAAVRPSASASAAEPSARGKKTPRGTAPKTMNAAPVTRPLRAAAERPAGRGAEPSASSSSERMPCSTARSASMTARSPQARSASTTASARPCASSSSSAASAKYLARYTAASLARVAARAARIAASSWRRTDLAQSSSARSER
mmetsp:Transcript_15382/g.52636  ORF Transcript_15382/g.52636 Transcript_15382/m.52636 type:complete len:200 (+) Transcript_15382:911-1510(+)